MALLTKKKVFSLNRNGGLDMFIGLIIGTTKIFILVIKY
jgi:hypothetical protein